MNKVIMISMLAVGFSSCAYFNTFHNTKELYNQAAKERSKRQDDQPTATERKLYDDTITKASKILELYPDSKYVDDALFILGECFYHKGEPVRAQRKFQELITYFPESGYYNRAHLWLAKVNVQLNDLASAKVMLNSLLEKSDLDKELRQEAHFLLGEIHFGQGYYEEAAHEYHEAAKLDKDDVITSDSWLHLGECQLFFGNNRAAVTSFKKAMDTSPDDLQGFDARLSYAKALKLSGDFKGAAKICNALLENQVYQKKHGYVQLEIADIIYWEGKALNKRLKGTDLQYTGKLEEAIEKYEIVILQHKRTEVSAIAHYRIARIKEELHDFAAAKTHYEKVKLEYSQCEHADEAEKKAKDIGDLIRLSNKVRKAQGEELLAAESGSTRKLSDLEILLLEHGVHPELRFREEQRKLALAEGRPDPTAEQNGIGNNELVQMGRLEELVTDKLQLAEIYLLQFGQVDSALAEYRQIVELFPDHPAAAKALFSSAYIYENEYQNKFKTDSLLYLIIERFPESRQAREAHRKLGLPLAGSDDPAAELYRRAEQQLFAHHQTHAAVEQYRRLIQLYPESEFAPKALYALGWIYEQLLFDNQKAAEVYAEIEENYPETEYFNRINQKLLALENNKPDFDATGSDAQRIETALTTPSAQANEELAQKEISSDQDLPSNEVGLAELKRRKLPDRRPSQLRGKPVP